MATYVNVHDTLLYSFQCGSHCNQQTFTLFIKMNAISDDSNILACSEALYGACLCHNKGIYSQTKAGTFTRDLRFAYLMKVITAFFYVIEFLGAHGTCLSEVENSPDYSGGEGAPSITQEQAGVFIN